MFHQQLKSKGGKEEEKEDEEERTPSTDLLTSGNPAVFKVY